MSEEPKRRMITLTQWTEVRYERNYTTFDELPPAPIHTDEEYDLLERRFKALIIVNGELEDLNEALQDKIDEITQSKDFREDETFGDADIPLEDDDLEVVKK